MTYEKPKMGGFSTFVMVFRIIGIVVNAICAIVFLMLGLMFGKDGVASTLTVNDIDLQILPNVADFMRNQFLIMAAFFLICAVLALLWVIALKGRKGSHKILLIVSYAVPAVFSLVYGFMAYNSTFTGADLITLNGMAALAGMMGLMFISQGIGSLLKGGLLFLYYVKSYKMQEYMDYSVQYAEPAYQAPQPQYQYQQAQQGYQQPGYPPQQAQPQYPSQDAYQQQYPQQQPPQYPQG